jgi:hypothetical protein
LRGSRAARCVVFSRLCRDQNRKGMAKAIPFLLQNIINNPIEFTNKINESVKKQIENEME